jgi:hypothetical protein
MVSHSAYILGHSNDTCELCLSLGYIGCLEALSLDDPSPSPKSSGDNDITVDLLTLESTRPADEHNKFQGWGDWETLMKDPLHSAILSQNKYRRTTVKCLRYRSDGATVDEHTLSGKSSFR